MWGAVRMARDAPMAPEVAQAHLDLLACCGFDADRELSARLVIAHPQRFLAVAHDGFAVAQLVGRWALLVKPTAVGVPLLAFLLTHGANSGNAFSLRQSQCSQCPQ